MTGEIVVAVPTFHRPDALDALLAALEPQVGAVGATILVIDNDPASSARTTALAHGARYVVEPARGLAAVRNRALDETPAAAALVFIDDDELPADAWLESLVDRWKHADVAAVSGRVESRFPPGFDDRWIRDGGFFERVRFSDGAMQAAAPTNNLLLDLTFVREKGLRFDATFGLTGGEDILFTKQLVAAGGRISSCPGALVYDDVVVERATRAWVLRRAYRVGISSVRTELRVRPGLRTRSTWIARGAVRVLAGGGRWVLGQVVRSTRHSARGARACWRGAGMLLGSLGVDYDEYARRT